MYVHEPGGRQAVASKDTTDAVHRVGWHLAQLQEVFGSDVEHLTGKDWDGEDTHAGNERWETIMQSTCYLLRDIVSENSQGTAYQPITTAISIRAQKFRARKILPRRSV